MILKIMMLENSKKARQISNLPLGYKNHKILIKPSYISNNFENICNELETLLHLLDYLD